MYKTTFFFIFPIKKQICFMPINSNQNHMIIMIWIPYSYKLIGYSMIKILINIQLFLINQLRQNYQLVDTCFIGMQQSEIEYSMSFDKVVQDYEIVLLIRAGNDLNYDKIYKSNLEMEIWMVQALNKINFLTMTP
ncbi:hypothetical protein V1478_008332 [Vespula squamosa]|uniref:Transmembrane protein n=1 Tax=Vespula squamosa TaxID=30214 RepID=A0ABD2AYG4_VESSQ